jgi:hypothetical protein
MNILNKINAKKVKFLLIKSKNNNFLKVHHGFTDGTEKSKQPPSQPSPTAKTTFPHGGKQPSVSPLGETGKGVD